MGRGIGFKKKQGEMVPADQISKIFRIKSRTLAEQFKELLANMPLERVRISDEIISHAKDHLKLKLNQSIYVTLTDFSYAEIILLLITFSIMILSMSFLFQTICFLTAE